MKCIQTNLYGANLQKVKSCNSLKRNNILILNEVLTLLNQDQVKPLELYLGQKKNITLKYFFSFLEKFHFLILILFHYFFKSKVKYVMLTEHLPVLVFQLLQPLQSTRPQFSIVQYYNSIIYILPQQRFIMKYAHKSQGRLSLGVPIVLGVLRSGIRSLQLLQIEPLASIPSLHCSVSPKLPRC